jgi:HPt (histidine-containing phosphotransfer) domain-containing protein
LRYNNKKLSQIYFRRGTYYEQACVNLMQRFFSLFSLFFLIVTLYAGERKVILSSFTTFDEAKKGLTQVGERIGEREWELARHYNFNVIARPSGKAFVVVLEPLSDNEGASVVLKHFQKYFPDAYVSDYFGYTQGSVVLKSQKQIEKKALEVIHQEHRDPIDSNVTTEACTISSISYIFILLSLSIIIVLGWILVKIFKEKQKNKAQTVVVPILTPTPIPIDLNLVIFWRYEEALKRSGGDVMLLNARIDSFIQNLPHMLHELKKMIAREDFLNLILQAHLLKSSAAGIAAHSLRIACKNLEIAAREKNNLLVTKNFEQCESIVKEILILLKNYKSKSYTEIKDVEDVTVSIGEQLSNIEQKIQQNIFVDTESCLLFRGTYKEDLAIVVKDFKQALDRLDYEKALVLLAVLKGELL